MSEAYFPTTQKEISDFQVSEIRSTFFADNQQATGHLLVYED